MAIYDNYAGRSRIAAGVRIKRHQAKVMFQLGLDASNCKQSPILEIGPGDGYIAELARDANLPYVAIEGSDAVAAGMERNGFKVVRGYVPPMPLELESGFGSCFLLHVLEHMKSPLEAARLIADIADRLNPGGVIVVACPDFSRWGQYFYDCDYTHAYPVTRRRLSQLLKDQGLEVISETVYTGPVFGYSGIPISWLAKLLYWPLLDDLMRFGAFQGFLNRGFLTFMPNLLTVARRPLA